MNGPPTRRFPPGERWRGLLVALSSFLVLALTASATPVILQENADGTRAMGLRQGTHAVGFEVIEREDRTRHINRRDQGTRLGLALWYPARRSTKRQPSMTTMEYRLTQFSGSPTPAERKTLEDEEMSALLGWRHVSIVPLTEEQARLSLETHGLAVRGAPAAHGRFPIVVACHRGTRNPHDTSH